MFPDLQLCLSRCADLSVVAFVSSCLPDSVGDGGRGGVRGVRGEGDVSLQAAERRGAEPRRQIHPQI